VQRDSTSKDTELDSDGSGGGAAADLNEGRLPGLRR